MDENENFFKRDKGTGENELIGNRGDIMDSERIIGKGDAVIVVLNKIINDLLWKNV